MFLQEKNNQKRFLSSLFLFLLRQLFWPNRVDGEIVVAGQMNAHHHSLVPTNRKFVEEQSLARVLFLFSQLLARADKELAARLQFVERIGGGRAGRVADENAVGAAGIVAHRSRTISDAKRV